MNKIELGTRWRTNPSHAAWQVERCLVDEKGKEAVQLRRNGLTKIIQIQHLMSGYMMVGSDKEARNIDAWKRNKWTLATDIING